MAMKTFTIGCDPETVEFESVVLGALLILILHLPETVVVGSGF